MDREIFDLIEREKERQQYNVELIASENFVSESVMRATGTILTNKYAEGYPSKRFYGGCEWVDKIENLAIDRAKELFNAAYVNVQPHSGSQANMAAIMSLIKSGDKILGMDLAHGGHLTHGSKVSFSGILYEAYSYGVERETGLINYDEVLKIAKEVRPKLIIAGASAYSREIDFKKFREIADNVGAYLLCDIAHIAGLVSAGFHNSSIDFAHITTTTTHKTLRGPRSGLILSGKDHEIPVNYNGSERTLGSAINSSVFPGIQGGPLMHVIAAKAVAFKEALDSSFKDYIAQVIKNAKAMAKVFMNSNFKVISDGTDNHLFLIDLSQKGITGRDAEEKLDKVSITVNKNSIPFDTKSPFLTSGIRIGTPAITTRGLRENDAIKVAQYIIQALDTKSESDLESLKREVRGFIGSFKLP